jgi:hypothetical protein
MTSPLARAHACIYNHLNRSIEPKTAVIVNQLTHTGNAAQIKLELSDFSWLRDAMARGQQQRCLALACLVAMCMSTASAFVFKAGGTGEWRVPGQANASGGNIASYNTWAEHTRFRVGDAIGKLLLSAIHD